MLGKKLRTVEELNLELYNKVCDEFEEYKSSLLTMSADEILEHAYAYAVREDIVLALEYNNIEAGQAEALLRLNKPLEAIFEKWETLEIQHMKCIKEAIGTRANDVAREQYLRASREKKARERDAR